MLITRTECLLNTCLLTYIYMCIYVYINVYICVYKCVYTCIYIYNHITHTKLIWLYGYIYSVYIRV